MTKDTCDPGSRRGRTFICQARTAAGKIRSFLRASLTPVPPWRDSGRNRFLILLVRACCALYFSLVLLLSVYRRISLWWTPVFCLLFFMLLTLCDRLLPDGPPAFKAYRRPWLWGAGFGFAAFLILLGFFFTCGVSADVDIRAALHSFNEGDYNDWHPFLHTLFLAGCLKIYDSISCIVLIQLIFFCCAFGCLAGILFQSGLPKYLSVPVLLYPLVSPQTHVFMMGCMKDSTLAAVMVPVCCCMIKIYLSGGQWLERRSRLIFFAVTLALATLLRHNAFFFTLPCLALLSVPAGVKRTLQCAGIFLLLIVLIKGPLYHWFGVSQGHRS